MAPKRTTRSTPATEITNTTSVTNAQLQEMIDQGVTAALAARDANRSTNGEDIHNSRTGVRKTKRVARECTYQDFMKSTALWKTKSSFPYVPFLELLQRGGTHTLALLVTTLHTQ
ncbi:hypothetical protein Tco_0299489 [Tanacetum coccineum]